MERLTWRWWGKLLPANLMPLVRDLAPDLVLFRLALPDLQSVEGIRHIMAASPEAESSPCPFYADRRFVVNILKAGASGYLLKDLLLRSWPKLSDRPGA